MSFNRLSEFAAGVRVGVFSPVPGIFLRFTRWQAIPWGWQRTHRAPCRVAQASHARLHPPRAVEQCTAALLRGGRSDYTPVGDAMESKVLFPSSFGARCLRSLGMGESVSPGFVQRVSLILGDCACGFPLRRAARATSPGFAGGGNITALPPPVGSTGGVNALR